jgi:hypothetical protein
LLKPSRTYFNFYKRGFLNSQAVRIRAKLPAKYLVHASFEEFPVEKNLA